MNNVNAGNDLNEYLQQLVAEACSYPAKSYKRQQKITKIVQVVTNSGKLWQENTPYYRDALQEVWINFCQNIEKYDSNRASVITWINKCLSWRLGDFRREEAESRAKTIIPRLETEETNALVDLLPAPPDIPPLLEETRNWVQTDTDGKLRNTLFRRRPEINAQVLILQRLPPDTPWNDIAAEFQLTPAEAKDLPKFYNRSCLPLLREFGSQQGYTE